MYAEVEIEKNLQLLHKTDEEISDFLYNNVIPVLETNRMIPFKMRNMGFHECVQHYNRIKEERRIFLISSFKRLLRIFSTKYEIIQDVTSTPMLTSGGLAIDLEFCFDLNCCYVDMYAAALCAGFKGFMYPLARDVRFNMRRKTETPIGVKRVPFPLRLANKRSSLRNMLVETDVLLNQTGVYLAATGNMNLPHNHNNFSLDGPETLTGHYGKECSLANIKKCLKFISMNYVPGNEYIPMENIYAKYKFASKDKVTYGDMILACVARGFGVLFKEEGGNYMQYGKVGATKRVVTPAANPVTDVVRGTPPAPGKKRKSEEEVDEPAKKSKK